MYAFIVNNLSKETISNFPRLAATLLKIEQRDTHALVERHDQNDGFGGAGDVRKRNALVHVVEGERHGAPVAIDFHGDNRVFGQGLCRAVDGAVRGAVVK